MSFVSTALVPSGAAGAAVALPPVGNIDAYISAVNRLPMLTAEQESELARRFREHTDLEAARELVMSHLRLVVSVARQYLGYGLPHADLIQEGNIGLMKAVKRFDPERGVRLVSFALHWIKAEIHEYILRNWRLVRVATTKAQRKLFFNLRSHKSSNRAMTDAEIEALARELNVRNIDVVEMETRLAGGDVALEGQTEDGEEDYAPSPIWRPLTPSLCNACRRAATTGCRAKASRRRWNRWTREAAASSKPGGCATTPRVAP